MSTTCLAYKMRVGYALLFTENERGLSIKETFYELQARLLTWPPCCLCHHAKNEQTRETFECLTITTEHSQLICIVSFVVFRFNLFFFHFGFTIKKLQYISYIASPPISIRFGTC